MKTPALFCAAAALLLLAGGAGAKDSLKSSTKTQRSHKAQAIKPAPPKDPYAKYWNDPGRAAPPFSYFGQP
jgi:hypothetical protein